MDITQTSWYKAKQLVDKIPDLDIRREAERSINDAANLGRCVTVFHKLYNMSIVPTNKAMLDFSHITKHRLAMRFGLIVEEFMELCSAMDIRADISFLYLDENEEWVTAKSVREVQTVEHFNNGTSSNDKGVTYLVDDSGPSYPRAVPWLVHDNLDDDELHAIVRERLQHAIIETDERDIVDVADACGDLKYVIQGFELEVGIPSNAVMAEIQCSNLSKLGEDGKPIYRDDGKVLKGPNYFKADIYGALRAHGLRITDASATRI